MEIKYRVVLFSIHVNSHIPRDLVSIFLALVVGRLAGFSRFAIFVYFMKGELP